MTFGAHRKLREIIDLLPPALIERNGRKRRAEIDEYNLKILWAEGSDRIGVQRITTGKALWLGDSKTVEIDELQPSVLEAILTDLIHVPAHKSGGCR